MHENMDIMAKLVWNICLISADEIISDLICAQQSDAAPLCEKYAKLYFVAKHLEKRLNRGC